MTHDDQDASPDEARAILGQLGAAWNADGPKEPCPFSLAAPRARGPNGSQGSQGSLF